jgi:hypothetical protein
MELQLVRTYHPIGTNGSIFNGEQFICSTMELPWKENKSRISCIPEPNRFFILIHPFNDAIKESKGCIAAVTKLTGPGKGILSRLAFEKLKTWVFPMLERNEKVFITITSCHVLRSQPS